MVTSSLVFILSAILSAKDLGAGFGVYAIASVIGLVLGAGNAWALYRLHGILMDRSKYDPQQRPLGYFYFACWGWIPIAGFFSYVVINTVLVRFVLW